MSDMFKKNYFAHVSPDGIGPSELAEQEGYRFILVGENLARGNFGSDKKLVQAWMDSPGHRDNILKPSYLELGVSVGQGEIAGLRTWIAVQSFGVSSDECLKGFDEEWMNQKVSEIEFTKGELERERELVQTQEDAVIFNEMLAVFRNEMAEFNLEREDYNKKVTLFNDCLAEFK